MQRRDFLKFLVALPIIAKVEANTLWLPPSVISNEEFKEAIAPAYEAVEAGGDIYGWIVPAEMMDSFDMWKYSLVESCGCFPEKKPLILLADNFVNYVGHDRFMSKPILTINSGKTTHRGSVMQKYVWKGSDTPNNGRDYIVASSWSDKNALLLQR